MQRIPKGRDQELKRFVGVAIAIALAVLSFGCADLRHSPTRFNEDFASLWASYNDLPRHRALVVAGPVDGVRWVAGVAAGASDPDAATSRAMAECRERRQVARMRAHCKLFAFDDERVGAAN